MFYLCIIQPHLEYSSNAFINLLSRSLFNRLQVAANDAVRAIFGFPDWCHVSPLYSKLCIAPIEQRYQFKCYSAAYRCAHALAPRLLANCLEFNARTTALTRQTSFQTFKLPPVHTKIGLQSFSFTAADSFNSLPAAIRSASNIVLFAKALKSFIGFLGRGQIARGDN